MSGASRAARFLLVPLAAVQLLAGHAGAQDRRAGSHWVATWGTAQQLYRAPAAGRGQAPAGPTPAMTGSPAGSSSAPALPGPGAAPPAAAAPAGRGGPQRRFGIPPALPGLANQTIRMIVRATLGGDRVRVRLANAFGAPATAIGAAHVAVRAGGAAIVPGTDRVLTFSGRPSATIFAGQVLVSDPVDLAVKAGGDLAVSLFLPQETGLPTSHTFGLRSTYVSRSGDVSGSIEMTDLAGTTQSWYWLAGVDVLAPAEAGALVTFGDSITDGDQSTPDANAMWPAILAGRLQATARPPRIGVVNAGISGNRLLGDNNSGLARLVAHALSVPGVRWVTLMEGINDITAATRPASPGAPAPPPFDADDLIAAYRQVIEAAHLQGVKVIGCTLTPFGGSAPFTEAGEAIRQGVNAWIRTAGMFDAVVDFDAATRDPNRPDRFRAEADSPDLLHPGDGGYRLMAEAFDLRIFGASPRTAGRPAGPRATARRRPGGR